MPSSSAACIVRTARVKFTFAEGFRACTAAASTVNRAAGPANWVPSKWRHCDEATKPHLRVQKVKYMFTASDTATEPEYKYITTEDLRAYADWCRPHVVRFCPQSPPPLYHYTSGNSLIDIIRGGELWSTQLACLNDASELLYPIETLQEKARQKLSTPVTADAKFLLERISSGLTEPQIATEGRFVACFSEDGDDLSQWRAYAGGEGGYAIQFDSQYLRRLPSSVITLGKVEYDVQVQRQFLDDVLQNLVGFFIDGIQKRRASSTEEWADEFVNYWANLLIVFAPYLKHPKFAGEREWRLVYCLQDEAIPRMRYLQRSSMMTQHVPLRLMMRGSDPCLPLKGIVVGPSRHKEISRISAADLLRTHGYSNQHVPVITTLIPYRLM